MTPCAVPAVNFIKAGAKPPTTTSQSPPLRSQMIGISLVDLPVAGTYLFPGHIAVTGKKPDLVLWSAPLKLIIIFELTVPSERNVYPANRRKRDKYGEAGYTVELLRVEVGALGYVADSMCYALKKLGVWSPVASTQMSEIALRCSYAIFIQRGTLAWTDWRMYVPQTVGEQENVRTNTPTNH